jgi:hypothetical protein
MGEESRQVGEREPSGLAADAVVALNPSWVLREEDGGEALLFDADSGAVWVANRTAVAVWKLVDGCRSAADLLEELRRTYAGFDEAAGAEVMGLLGGLVEAGALSASPTAPLTASP